MAAFMALRAETSESRVVVVASVDRRRRMINTEVMVVVVEVVMIIERLNGGNEVFSSVESESFYWGGFGSCDWVVGF